MICISSTFVGSPCSIVFEKGHINKTEVNEQIIFEGLNKCLKEKSTTLGIYDNLMNFLKTHIFTLSFVLFFFLQMMFILWTLC